MVVHGGVPTMIHNAFDFAMTFGSADIEEA